MIIPKVFWISYFNACSHYFEHHQSGRKDLRNWTFITIDRFVNHIFFWSWHTEISVFFLFWKRILKSYLLERWNMEWLGVIKHWFKLFEKLVATLERIVGIILNLVISKLNIFKKLMHFFFNILYYQFFNNVFWSVSSSPLIKRNSMKLLALPNKLSQNFFSYTCWNFYNILNEFTHPLAPNLDICFHKLTY